MKSLIYDTKSSIYDTLFLIYDTQLQIKVLSDAHAVAQRKLDAILAGQTM